MISKKITDKEYEKLVARLAAFDTMRDNLLTFSFTSVLAVLGIIIGSDNPNITASVCLIPFFLIIPFAARVSYYRLASAHIGSFLKTFAPEQTVFENGTKLVPEGQCNFFGLIVKLVNYEMVCLALAVDACFYYKYLPNVTVWSLKEYIFMLVPMALTIVVFLISNATYIISIACCMGPNTNTKKLYESGFLASKKYLLPASAF